MKHARLMKHAITVLLVCASIAAASPRWLVVTVDDATGVVIRRRATSEDVPSTVSEPGTTKMVIPWADLESEGMTPLTTHRNIDAPTHRYRNGVIELRPALSVHQDIRQKERARSLEGLITVRARLREVEAEIAEVGSSPARVALRNRLIADRDRLRQEAVAP